jgi:hypothetical protein
MKTLRQLLVCTVLCGFVSTLFAADNAKPAALGLREILAKHRNAQGLGDYGKQKLHGFSAIRVTRKVTHSGQPQYEKNCEAKEPDRVRMEDGANSTITIMTTSFRIETDKSGGVNRRPAEPFHDSVIAMCLINPSKSATVEKVRYVGKERVNGKAAYHLLAMDDVGNYDEWIDAKDFTLVKRQQSGVILSTTEEWNDFRNVSGLMVPFDHFTRNTSTLNPWTEDEALTKMDFDPSINDADFAETSTKSTMGTTSASGQTSSGGPQVVGNVGGQNVSLDMNNVLATLSGRQQQQQQQPAQTTTTQSSTSSDQQQTQQQAVANQVAQAAANPNATAATAQQAATTGKVPSNAAPGATAVRSLGHGTVISPACSDATNMVTIDEISTGYKDPSADMRLTVTNTSSEDLYVERVNCKETSIVKPHESKRCIYSSNSGWAVVVARNRDIAGGGACSNAFSAASAAQETKLGLGR